MSHENDELFQSFVEEAQETLADIENDFLAIEAAGKNFDKGLVNKIFRGIHSMKGSAGFLGLKAIGALAHEGENIMNLIRNGELIPNARIVNALLKAADCLRQMVSQVHTSNEVDIAPFVGELKAVMTAETTDDIQAAANREVDIALPDGRMAFVMVKELPLVLRQRQGCHIYILDVDLFADVQDKQRTPLQFLQQIYQQGELIDSYVRLMGVGDLTSQLPESMSFVLLLGSKLSGAELAEALNLPEAKIFHIAAPEQTDWQAGGPRAAQAPPVAVAVPPPPPQVVTPVAVVSAVPEPVEEHLAAVAGPESGNVDGGASDSRQTSLRVNVKVLDTLMNLAGELVLGRNQLLQEASTRENRGIESVAARIDQVTSELQEAIMQTRMQPIGNVFSKFPRVVRDLSSKLGKQSDLEVEGKDVEMDKAIIEAIGDPLTHLIRNAIDHGIELPAQRTAQKKKPCGIIKLRAYHQAGKINIAISDDGAGVDTKLLKQKAIEKGLINADQAREMSQRDAVRLIFHPGLSTAKVVSDVSGRGVGMDVVKTNIEKLGGTVDVDTEVGIGTTIVIKLPLTLAIIPSLIVRSGENKFAIPQVNISELVRIKSGEIAQKIEQIKDAELLRLRGTLLPLVRLSRALGFQTLYRDARTGDLKENQRTVIAEVQDPSLERRNCTVAGALSIIVVETGHLRYGLIVDELYDSKEIVVKPLGRHIKDCPCLAGATILGDGNVSMILDITGISTFLKLAMPDAQAEEAQSDSEVAHRQGIETQSTLIFTNDPHEYFGVPTEFVSRIERIRADQIDTVGGQEVLQYRGSSLPLLSLERYVKAQPRPQQTSLFVVVFKMSGREVGLVAPDLVDITPLSTAIDNSTFHDQGIIGSIIMDEKTIRLVDVFQLAEVAHPDWFVTKDNSSAGHTKKKTVQTILLAEDSSFFRQQVSSFIKAAGYEIIACEDGQEAWNLLQEGQVVDLVVTDIEMPNLNGLELTQKIRQSPAHSHLPIIAVTSLAGEEDAKQARQAGVNEYHIKLDRDQLLGAISRFLQPVVVA